MSLAVFVNKVPAPDAVVYVPNQGVWIADVSFDVEPAPTGSVTLALGDVQFSGTVDPRFSGAFNTHQRLRIVGGANAWPNEIPGKHTHNDAGVKASAILRDVASAVGEELAFTQADARLGVDFVRKRGPASDMLRRLATRWHVDYAGKTQVGPRVVPALGKFDLLNFDAQNNLVEIGTEDAACVSIGSVITDGIDAPLTVQQLEIRVENGRGRIFAWGSS